MGRETGCFMSDNRMRGRMLSGMLDGVRIVIHPHALVHGLSAEQIRSAYETGSGGAVIRYRDREAEPPRWATIGFDAEGRSIELVFVRLDDFTPLVIHANYLTKGFRDEVRRSR